MGDTTTTTATPLANSSGITEEALQRVLGQAVTAAVAAAVKPLNEQIAQLQEAQSKAPTADALAKQIQDGLTAQQKAAADAAAVTQAKTSARQKVIDAKLKGVPDSLLGSLPDTADEAALSAAADALRKTLESLPGVKLSDVGGASKDGGAAAGSSAARITSTNSGLTDGQAKFANEIKLPAGK